MSWSDVVAAVRSLRDGERRILEGLALAGEPCSPSRLSDLLKRLDARNQAAFGVEAVTNALARGTALGLARDLGGEHTLTTLATHALLFEMSRQHRLRTLAEKMMGGAPRFGWSVSDSGSDTRRTRDLVLNLHLGQSAVVADMLARSPARGMEHDALVEGLGFDVPAQVLDLLPPDLADEYVKRALPRALARLASLGSDVHARLFASQWNDGEFVADRSLYAALRGRLDTARSLLGAHQHAAVEAVHAVLDLFGGDLAASRRHARRAIALSQGPKQRLLGGIPGVAMPVAGLGLITSGEREDLSTFQIQTRVAAGNPQFHHVSAYRALGAAMDAFEDGPYQVEARLREAESDPELTRDWLAALCWGALACWFQESPSEVFLGSLTRAADAATASGFVGLARELSALASRGESSRIAQLHRPIPAWELALGALTAELDRVAPSLHTDPQRLVWQVQLHGDELDVGAYSEQAEGARKGTRQLVPWRKLLDMALSETWLDEHDRRVIAQLELVDVPGDGSPALGLSARAPLALVGHPRVCWSDDPRAFVPVIAQRPRVVVTGEGASLEVRVEPRAVRDGRVAVERDGDALLVYALSDAQQRIAKTLELQALTLPSDQSARLTPALARLAGVFDVESAVDVPGAEETSVKVDRLTIQLWRRAKGLAVRLRVRPFGTVGPSFAPGKGQKVVLTSVTEGGARRTMQARRDLGAEEELVKTLYERAPMLSTAAREGQDLRMADPLDCLELLDQLGTLGDAVRIEWPEGQPLKVAGTLGTNHLSLRLKSGEGWLEASGEISASPELTLELRELVKRLSSAPGRFVELDAGRFVALSQDLRDKLTQLADLGEESEGGLKLPALSLGAMASWVDEVAELDPGARLRLERVREAQTLTVELPSELDATLRSYQREGFTWLTQLGHWGAGAILADDMGLGKTVQVLALLLTRRALGPALVVAPTSVCPNWLEEATRFARVLHVEQLGTDRARTIAALGPNDVLVCSYGIMQQEIERLAKKTFATVVLDEAQAIKNASTQRARAAHALRGDVRIAMTGTPVENHLGELWSIFSFVNPGLLGTARQFDERFGRPIQKDASREASERLKRAVRPFVLRRTKAEVLSELPEKTEITLHIEQSAEERAFYEALRREAVSRLHDSRKPGQERMRLLADLMRLRRAACHPKLVAPETELGSAKLTSFLAIVDELRDEGHRALVFSQFVDHLELVRNALDARNISYQYLDGGTPQEQRAAAVRAFQDGAGDLFLISLRAGGFGLNLTAADYVIHLDPWWNPAVEDQATDRAHRIGQTRPLTVYRLVTRDTVEEKILVLHEEKRALLDAVLDGSSGKGGLDLDELRAILADTSELRA